MGFFSEIASEARRSMAAPTRQTSAPSAAPEPPPAPPVAAPEAPAVQPVPTPTAGASSPPQTPHQSEATPSAHTPPPEIKLAVDQAPDDTAARRAHEEAEARRKAEWDSRQREKKAAEQARLGRLASMSDEDVVAASTQRVSADTEKLTRRSMKDCVSEYIQAMCRQNPTFARKTMHPRKSMMHCFWYINRMAKEFIQKEMKANGVQPESGVYGDDVPDDLVYQWAVDYFNAPDVQEDKEKEEKFVPRPYVGKSSVSKIAAKSKAKKEPAPKAVPKPQADANVDGQLSFMGVAG